MGYFFIARDFYFTGCGFSGAVVGDHILKIHKEIAHYPIAEEEVKACALIGSFGGGKEMAIAKIIAE